MSTCCVLTSRTPTTPRATSTASSMAAVPSSATPPAFASTGMRYFRVSGCVARAPHEHDPILLGELVERGLEHGDVPSRLGVEALEEGRLGLVQARELLLEESVAERRLGNELLIDVVAAQALGHLLGDLRTARADLVRHGQDGHGRHSFLYLARSAAGAMAMRLPLTSSRT